MNLEMPGEMGMAYKSLSQRARVVSEAWGAQNLYCANCESDRLLPLPTNTRVVDFACPECASQFQLKSQSKPLRGQLADAGYQAMRDAIQRSGPANLFALHYDPNKWAVKSLIVVPRFVFSMSAIQKRNPLTPTAERHGHVLCTILLRNLPPEARIAVVTEGAVANPAFVREQYARLKPLAKSRAEARGWTLDVLNAVRRLGKREFTLGEVYAFRDELAHLHPKNHRIEPKIRQQLQILRDMGFVEFLGRGRYRA